ncbi:MAG: M23 family metallopeptidase [Bacteroidetes bacterium]|nr:M23 family metallopeptidase [Bacteroidota bacterium]
MLRTIIRLLCIAAAAFVFPSGMNRVTGFAPEPLRTDFNPYDTIRTDLSAYIWPMKTSTVMTSSFGEYRSTHFHAGIDISTGDTLGLPVMASRDGYVRRITISPTGYGKIIHIRHRDGYTTSYAHLQGFPPWIDSLVKAEQYRKGRFPVELEFPPDELPVTAGQTIAYAGDTGSGSAHLHFEIRDENRNTINPLLAEPFSVQDGLPPIFRGIAFVPLDSTGLIDGEPKPRAIASRQVSSSRYTLDQSPLLDGTVGLAADVRDRSDFSNYFHGYYTLRLEVDSVHVFDVRYDRVPLRDGHQIRLVYLQDPEMKRRGRFHKLFLDTYHRLPIFPGMEYGSGMLITPLLPPGRHTFAITCVDYNGNASVLSGSFRTRAENVRPHRSAGEAPSAANNYRPHPAGSPGVRTHRIDPALAGVIEVDGGALRIRHRPGSLFHPIDLTATPVDEKGVVGYDIEPAGIPLDDGLEFELQVPSWMKHAGVYTRSEKSWTFLSRAEPDSLGRVSTTLHRFLGDIALREDAVPPEVYRLRIDGQGPRPLISFRFRDNLAGVEYREVKVYIDSTMIIPEIDGEHRRVTAQPATPLARGPHRLTIQLADKMGNRFFHERSFRVR